MAAYYYNVAIKSNVELDRDDLEEILSVNLDTVVQITDFDLEDTVYSEV